MKDCYAFNNIALYPLTEAYLTLSQGLVQSHTKELQQIARSPHAYLKASATALIALAVVAVSFAVYTTTALPLVLCGFSAVAHILNYEKYKSILAAQELVANVVNTKFSMSQIVDLDSRHRDVFFDLSSKVNTYFDEDHRIKKESINAFCQAILQNTTFSLKNKEKKSLIYYFRVHGLNAYLMKVTNERKNTTGMFFFQQESAESENWIACETQGLDLVNDKKKCERQETRREILNPARLVGYIDMLTNQHHNYGYSLNDLNRVKKG